MKTLHTAFLLLMATVPLVFAPPPRMMSKKSAHHTICKGSMHAKAAKAGGCKRLCR